MTNGISLARSGPKCSAPYRSAMVLLTLTEDEETGEPVWVVEFDDILAGRFKSEDEVVSYLRRMGYRIDLSEEWPRHRLL